MTVYFKKYPSLTNHYNVPADRTLRTYLKGEENGNILWYATEKVDGTNISVHINLLDGSYVLASRNRLIDFDAHEDKMYNGLDTFINEEVVADIVKNAVYYFKNPASITRPEVPILHIWGEYYGSKIQKHDYALAKDQKRNVILFDAMIGDERLPYDGLLSIIPIKFSPHIVDEPKPLSDWLKDEPYNQSYYGGTSEGIVIKPINGSLYNPEIGTTGTFLGVKYKTEAYLETKNIGKRVKVPIEVANPELVNDLRRYLTVNRVMNIISHGDIEPILPNFGQFRKALYEDIIKEYSDDKGLEKLSGSYTDKDIKEAINRGLNREMSQVVREALTSL